MSLINDALKQARQSQQPNQTDGQPPLRPVAPAPRGAANWLLALVVIALVGAAAFFIWLALAGHKTPPAKAPEIPAAQTVVSQPAAAQPVAAKPAVAPAVAPVPPAVVRDTNPPAVVRVTNAPAVKKTVAAVPLSTADIKLQGIIYDAKPWAIVNGKTVYVGDRVGGFRVVEISPDSITLEGPDGSRQKLVLGE
jgi:cytoskeletal protein RodZ